MSAWPGKYVIGLTGNIATGKSVVRRMLEHLGAYGIDADALSHRAVAQGAPAYQPVLEMFGKWILTPDGQIDRARLGKIVFADPDALAMLESIVHPPVRQAIDLLARRAPQKVLVIEAIKLLEGPLKAASDSIWVTYAPAKVQVARLVQKRGLTDAIARQRITSQPTQEEKLAAATLIIHNDGSFDDTWQQVVNAWQKIVPGIEPFLIPTPGPKGALVVERAGPRQAEEIAEFITRVTKGRRKVRRVDIMAAFGEKAFLALRVDGRIVGLVGWQVENLVARTADVYLESGLALNEAMRVLLDEVERASRELQCEALLLFLPPNLARQEAVWSGLRYESRAVKELGVSAWQEAALESMPDGTVMFFKQLRKDRVLRPV